MFPGVGNFGHVCASLRDKGYAEPLKHYIDAGKPFMGICVGMQLLCSHSEEGDVPCIGIFPETVKRFRPHNGDKVPHMGWNNITLTDKNDWVSPEVNGEFCYYVHSYYVEPGPNTIATTAYAGVENAAMLRKDNFYAAQFHPEKSALVGEQIIRDFLAVTP